MLAHMTAKYHEMRQELGVGTEDDNKFSLHEITENVFASDDEDTNDEYEKNSEVKVRMWVGTGSQLHEVTKDTTKRVPLPTGVHATYAMKEVVIAMGATEHESGDIFDPIAQLSHHRIAPC